MLAASIGWCGGKSEWLGCGADKLDANPIAEEGETEQCGVVPNVERGKWDGPEEATVELRCAGSVLSHESQAESRPLDC